MNVKIKELPVEERPRERLISCGVEQISNEELLSILLKTGTISTSSKVIASQLLMHFGTIQGLKDATLEQLVGIHGIGEAKACTILAMIELGKRMHRHSTIKQVKMSNVETVYEYYREILGNKKQEYFYCIYLDNKNHVIKDKQLFVGTINYSIIHPREIFKEAYLVSATSIICVHNHPSGNVEPSREDKAMTLRVKEVGELLGIRLLDHLIIGVHGYYSFLENDAI